MAYLDSETTGWKAQTDNCEVLYKGTRVFKGNADQCWVYIHTHQSNSVDFACRHEEWQVLDLEDKNKEKKEEND